MSEFLARPGSAYRRKVNPTSNKTEFEPTNDPEYLIKH